MPDRLTCDRCGRTFYNRAWHAEQCDGLARLDRQPPAVLSSRLVCGKLTSVLPVKRCRLDEGHLGECRGERGL